jgi:hypothetical protein
MSEYIRSSTICKAAKLVGALRMMQFGLRPYPGATWEGLLQEATKMTGEEFPVNGPTMTANKAIDSIMNFVKRVDITATD